MPGQPRIGSVIKDGSIKTATEGAPLTALAGGGQTNATLLAYGANEVGVVANANDSLMLPVAAGGKVVFVANSGANSAQVYGQPSTSDIINDVASGTGVAVANAKRALFFCTRSSNPTMGIAGKWYMILTA